MNARVKVTSTAAITGCVLAALAGIAAAPAAAAPASLPTVVYGFGDHCPSGKWGIPEVRPSRAWFTLACEDVGLPSQGWSRPFGWRTG